MNVRHLFRKAVEFASGGHGYVTGHGHGKTVVTFLAVVSGTNEQGALVICDIKIGRWVPGYKGHGKGYRRRVQRCGKKFGNDLGFGLPEDHEHFGIIEVGSRPRVGHDFLKGLYESHTITLLFIGLIGKVGIYDNSSLPW